MSFAANIDPNLEEVLRDVAKDPNSKLFSSLRLGNLQASMRAPVDTITQTSVGFSTAERELLFMHRRGLGQVLEEAFLAAYLADSERARWVRPIGDVKSLAAAQKDAIRARDLAPAAAFRGGAANQISMLLDGELPATAGGLRQLAATALKVGGTAKARYYYALACDKSGDAETALEEAKRVSAGCDPSVSLMGMSLMRRVLVNKGLELKADQVSRLAMERCTLYGEERIFEIELSHGLVHCILHKNVPQFAEYAAMAAGCRETVLNVMASSIAMLNQEQATNSWTKGRVRHILECPGDLK